MVATLKTLVLKDKDWIKRDQDGIKKSVVGLQQRIHANFIQCMLHAKEYGDTSLMARLIESLGDTKSVVRVQALINSMRKYSPMELKGKTINLSGVDASGNKRPWKIDEADQKPFWTDRDNREMVVKPVFRQNVLGKFDAGAREFRKAWENTSDGQPIDPTKPFYDGIHGDKVLDFLTEVGKLQANLGKDATQEVRKMQQTIRASGMSSDEIVKLIADKPHNEQADIISEDAEIEATGGDEEAVVETGENEKLRAEG